MAAKSEEEVKQALAAERERLGDAVSTLRSRLDETRRKLPILAGAATGAGMVLTVARRLVRKRRARPERKRRRRFRDER
jgi:hypothetical protein